MIVKQLFPVFTNFTGIVLRNIRPCVCSGYREIPSLDFVRYAARRGTRAAKLAAKKAKKQQDATKTSQPIPKYLLRKVKMSTELERKRCTDENWLETQPIDNVWNMKLYRGKPYSVAEAIEMHKERHAPEMLNDPTAFIYANIELDLKLKKKDRFLEDITGTVTYPREFEALKSNKMIVVCKSDEEQAKAVDAGAVYSGSSSLIKQILSGAISSDEYDYVICHPDSLKELHVLRGILGKKFPNAHNGLLRLDIEQAIISFSKAVEFKLKHSTIEPDFGWLDVCFGRLNMSKEHLEENLTHLLKTVEKFKPIGTQDIMFIIRTLLWCEKSREKFKIPHWKYLPDYPENGVRNLEEEEEIEEIGEN